MNEQAARDLRRLGVFSLGFLWQPALRRALADAGWRVGPGAAPHDAIGVWGRRGAARSGLTAARVTGKQVITIEDGFLRSVHPGGSRPVISLILDDVGVYYDSAAPSRLEQLITDGDGDLKRAEAGIARLRAARLSKYNHAPALLDPPSGHILVVDQTRGDASITYGGATADNFDRMLAAARSDHPGCEIIVKSHPDVVMGRKAGHLTPDRAQGARLITDDANP